MALNLSPPSVWWGHGLAAASAGHGLRLLLAGFFFASAWALGDALLAGLCRLERWKADRVGVRTDAPGAGADLTRRIDGGMASLRIALGVSVLSLTLFGLAAWHLWSPVAFRWLAVAQGAVLVARWPRQRQSGVSRSRLGRFPRVALAGIALALVYMVPSLLTALAPPFGWDDQVYHLPLPKAYLAEGGFFPMAWQYYAQHPGAIDLLYGWGMGVGDDIVAVLLHFGLGMTVGLGLWETGRALGFRRAAWFAPALFYCHFMVGEEMGWAFADVGMAAFLLPAWWMLWRWSRDRAGHSGWIAAGMTAGMVCASKYTGAFLIAGVGLWAIAWSGFSTRPRRGASERLSSMGRLIPGVIGFGGVGFLFLLPWLAKNWIFTGNPVWPMFFSVFGGEEWSASLGEMLVAYQRGDYGRGRAPLDWVLLLPRLFFQSTYEVYDFGGPLAALPLVGMAASLAIPVGNRRRAWIPASGFLLLFGVWAFVIQLQQSRFLIPALPLLALACLPAVEAAIGNGRTWIRATAAGTLLLALACNVSETVLPRWRSALAGSSMLAGADEREAFLRSRVRSYACFRFIESIPVRERGRYVAFAFEPMGYYADFPHRLDQMHHSLLLDAAGRCANGRQLAEYLSDRGVNFVLVNHNILDGFLTLLDTPPGFTIFGGDPVLLARYRDQLAVLLDFLKRHATEVFRANNSAVYRVQP